MAAALSAMGLLGACSDGSVPVQGDAGGASSGNAPGTGGTPVAAGGTGGAGGSTGGTGTGTGGSNMAGTGTATGGTVSNGGSSGSGMTTGGTTPGGTGGSTGGTGMGGMSMGGMANTAGSVATTGGAEAGGTAGMGMGGMAGSAAGGSAGGAGGTGAVGPTGPFKVLILSTYLEYKHDSIPTCQQLVADLGKADPDPNNQWTTQIETDDLKDFTDDGLKQFGLLFWCSPTGTVFSGNPKVKDKQVAMQALQKYVEGGGAWGGVHSASDFEKTNGFPWFTNTLMGGYFQDHDNDGTPGSVQVQSMYTSHPVAKGLSGTYSTQDEWYVMSKDVSAQPGFQIIQRLTKDNRPITWIKELGSGRMFYTVRGHNKTVYAEKEFRQLVQNGIMWVTKRTN